MSPGEAPGGASGHDHLVCWGIEQRYKDATGEWRDAPNETLAAVLAALGGDGGGWPPPNAPVVVVGDREQWPLVPAGTLHLEKGGAVEVPEGAERRPGDIPVGYHVLELRDDRSDAQGHFAKAGTGGDPSGGARKGAAEAASGGLAGGEVLVAVCPAACPAPPAGRSWGWSVQLYAARSARSWGIGDFADLAALAGWARRNGADFVLLNPLHAPAPGPDPEPSPYFPSSRCFLNPLYISVPGVAGAGELPGFDALEEKATALNADRLIDRGRVWSYKSEALEALFERFEQRGGAGAFDDYITERGKVLDGYTTFCALAEIFGLPWQEWPAEYQHPSASTVADLAATARVQRRKRYHAWLQWTCEQQLQKAATCGAGLVVDIAVGVDGKGADAWLWQDLLALGMRVGAPPDSFNVKGQDWGLPPFDPWKLRSAAYEPYIEMLRSALRPAIGLRVDHVMGLFRLFWIPLGTEPKDGTYVHYPWPEMLGLLRLEASRAGAFVVGEDLGTVEPEVRSCLAASGVLSYRLFWFEEKPPPEWPAQALGAVTTHDLPTVAGVWDGSDAEAQRHLGLQVDESTNEALRRRLLEWTGSREGSPVAEVIEATYAAVAKAPCELLAAVLEDAAAVEDRPNMPGTTGGWPNWSLALPVQIEELEDSDLAAAIARQLGRRRS